MTAGAQPRGDAIVVIGASWGGMEAARVVLAGLDRSFPAPVVFALHRSARSEDDMLERVLAKGAAIAICEADDKTPLSPGCVYVAPADYHLLVEGGHLALSTEGPVNFSRPSIDVLFESAADAYGAGVVAVVLTGANADGAEGLRRVRDAGGVAVVQDPSTATRREMPEAAIATGAVHHVVPLEGVSPLLNRLLRGSTR